MPPHRPKLPPPPEPTRITFDPFNSSSTGHQRAESGLAGTSSWLESRTYKLSHQLRDRSGRGGEQHLADLVGGGSENFGKDGRKGNGDWEAGAPGLREKGWQDIRDLMAGSRKRSLESEETEPEIKKLKSSNELVRDVNGATPHETSELTPESTSPPQIFRSLTMYLNGSTAPLISDHKLKQLFVQHGGNTSIALGRRTVTHVVLGNTCGGGLASRKIEKEVALVRGKGVKYVTAQWVLDSVEKGIRQSEARYVPKPVDGRIGGSRQASVRGMFLQPGTTK